MIKSGIEIKWDGEVEYISIDFNKLSTHLPIHSTLAWWTAERIFVSYVTSGHITRVGDGVFELRIRYDRSKNGHIADGAVYGTSKIILKTPFKIGEAYWHEKGKRPETEPATWKRVTLDIVKKKASVTHTVTKKERQQAMFRLALLGRYRCCALTGETTPSALEASHIIASSKDGNEIIGNGILLRADIHRLYDDGAFKISKSGVIIVASSYPLSDKYKKLLNGAKLPSDVGADLG